MDYELMMNGNVKIGQQAPEFTAITTCGEINLNDYKGKWLVLFSHPGDFTPVCTTEMIAFSRAYPYFQKLNTELLGLSIDSNSSHLAWMNDIHMRTGIRIPFPIIADRSGEIARKYGMISTEVSNTETVRNVFIIDGKGIVRTILIYPLNVGRFIPEIIRTIQALQMADCTNCSTPANWTLGNSVIVPAPKTYYELEQRNKEIQQNRNGMNWYLSFKEPCQDCIDKVNLNENDNCERLEE
ncbi:MAG: peroxiredoxin [Clostridia bacterium]|nr:peroxiredoxin [Clostridia bacterium]